MHFIKNYFKDTKGEESALRFKKMILRYCALSYALLMTTICPEMKKKFSDHGSIFEKGLATQFEIKCLRMKQTCTTWMEKWWIPINWACCITQKARSLL